LAKIATSSKPKTGRARLPQDRRSTRALDLQSFAPALITLLAHRITNTASALYRPRFGVGITDWRVMAVLASEPWIAPVRIAEATGLDKAAVSRSLRDLRQAGIVEASATAPGKRRSVVALTVAGVALHDQMVVLAKQRERGLLGDFTAPERAQLLAYIARMLSAIDGF
jgi:DNA-binding MarR family transcriptional regulator